MPLKVMEKEVAAKSFFSLLATKLHHQLEGKAYLHCLRVVVVILTLSPTLLFFFFFFFFFFFCCVVVPRTSEGLSEEEILERVAARRVPHPYFVIVCMTYTVLGTDFHFLIQVYVAITRIVARRLKLPPPRIIIAFTPVSSVSTCSFLTIISI